ncbi:unnamed protein product [Thlaspi arvense]|uniref:Uncharacterized protein n=1 Tax=Thlaspi arvense TaxID=13288 RepID=A0AAU9SEB3_THLAR|nr:unnamed protein product [Thlaspi arvense]
MAENVEDDESEFDSVTSSQKSFLKNCPFADPESPPTESSGGVAETDWESTEILGNPISPAVVRTPVLSFPTPTSIDSINDEDVFRTPPENASLSSAADSEPRVRVSEMKPAGGSKSKSQSSKSETTTPVSASPSLTAENVRVTLSSPTSVAEDDVRVPRKRSNVGSPSPTAIGRIMVLENRPISDSVSNTGVPKSPSPTRAPGKHSDLDSPSPVSMARTIVLENQSNSASVATTGLPKSPSPGKHLNLDSSSPSSATDETDIPFKEIFEALLRNNGQNLNEKDEKVSYFDILKQCGLKFP